MLELEADAKKNHVAIDRDIQNHILNSQKAHLQLAKDLRENWKAHIHAALARLGREGKMTSVCKIEDNMGSVLLPSSHSMFLESKRSYGDFLQLHPGGTQTTLGPDKQRTKYFLISEAVSNENTNTILTELALDLLEDLKTFPDMEDLHLLLDRHTTGWNKTMISFWQLVCHHQILKKVEPQTHHPGHHINNLDHTNGVTSRAYVRNSKRSFLGISNMNDAVASFQKASDSFIVCPLFAVLNFKAAFADIVITPGPHMSANIIEITAAGIRSKQDPAEPWNKWFGGNEQVFHRIVPVGTVLPLVKLADSQRLDAEHLNTIRGVVASVHLENDPYWVSVFSGGVGGEPNITPFDLNTVPRRFGGVAVQAGEPGVVAGVAPPGIAIVPPEIVTESVLDHGPSAVYDGEYTFRVKYSDGDVKWANLDDLVDLDFTINASLLNYLAPHPQIKKKGVLVYHVCVLTCSSQLLLM